MSDDRSIHAAPKGRFAPGKRMAEILGPPFTDQWFRKNRCSSDPCPHYKLGALVVYEVDETIEWVRSHRRANTADKDLRFGREIYERESRERAANGGAST